MLGHCTIIDYLLATVIILSNSLTIYFIFPIIADFIQLYVEDDNIYTKGFYIGLILTSYELGKILGSYFWKKIANFLGTPMCISISLFLITFLNFTFVFVTNLAYLVLIRFLTGLANNLFTFLQSYLFEIFPSNKHKKVLQLFTFFQNLAVSIAMLSGLLISLGSSIDSVDKVGNLNENFNKYFIIAFTVCFINFTAFIFNLIKYKLKIIIPKRRTQFYEQCDLNLELSRRESIIIQKKGSEESGENFRNKRNSLSGLKVDSVSGMDKSNLHNPNKIESDKYHPFGTNKKLIEIQLKRHEETTQNDEKEIEINKVEENLDHDSNKKTEIEININPDFESADNNLSGISITKKQFDNLMNNPQSPDNMKAGFYQLNEEPQEISNNRETSNLDLSKNTIGIKQSIRFTQTTNKTEIKESSEDDLKNIPIRFKQLNKKSAEKKNDIIVSNGSDSIMRSNSILTESGIKNRLDCVTLFKISSIYTNLQICDIILYNIFFLNLAIILNKSLSQPEEITENNQNSIFLTSTALALYHIIYTMLMPVVNSQVIRIGLKSTKKAVKVFKIFIYISMVLLAVFLLLDYFLRSQGLTYVIVLMTTLILRNLSLTVVLICYNILVMKISQSQVKEKLHMLQNYFSLSIRTVTGMMSCFLYLYFFDYYYVIVFFLGIVPALLLLMNLKLVKNLSDLIEI